CESEKASLMCFFQDFRLSIAVEELPRFYAFRFSSWLWQEQLCVRTKRPDDVGRTMACLGWFALGPLS
ncbi:MAG: hypothetical protein ABSA81_08050, partial [Candidatus Bathyarchaeia archaeon]